jgi:cell division inhibitor SepF
MANILKSFLNSMKLTEDDDDFDDYLDDEKEIIKPTRQERKAQKAESNLEQAYFDKSKSKSAVSSDMKKEKVFRMEKSSANKVVPIRTTSKGLEVCILKPTSFEDSQEICDMLLSGRATVINLEGFDDKLAQRTMDFVSGSVYAINGKLHRISNSIFIVSPDTIDISGDYLDIIQDTGFEPPTFHSQF